MNVEDYLYVYFSVIAKAVELYPTSDKDVVYQLSANDKNSTISFKELVKNAWSYNYDNFLLILLVMVFLKELWLNK